MAAKENLTVAADFAVKAREIDFVTRFGKNWDSLREVLGIMRPIVKAPGTKLVSYEASMKSEALVGGASVGEGEEIPYTEFQVTPSAYGDITLEKYAKAVSIEAVNKWGAAIAVQKTDDAFLNELQANVLSRFYAFLQTGTLTSSEDTLQMAIAMAIGRVKDKFKKIHRDVTSIVVWVNTLDAYQYLGAANLTVQTLFGIDYVENFMGADKLIISSEIPSGKVIATPVENIDLYYVDPGNSEFGQLGLNYTVQGETNLIGFHANGDYSHAVGESFALMGLTLWAEYLNGIAVITVGETPAEVPSVLLDKSTATLTAVDATVDLVATTVPADAVVTWASDDENVATVSDGTVTAVAEGTANISATITVDDKDYSDVCEVTVSLGV